MSAIDTEVQGAQAQLEQTARQAEDAGDMDRALGFFRALAQVDSANPRWPLEAIRVLRKSGRMGEATGALRQTLRRWPKLLNSELYRQLLPELTLTEETQMKALGDDVPTDAQLKRPVIEDDGTPDVIVGRGGRKTAVIVFTGLADRMVMPLPLFDRYLAELDLTSIFLRDQRRFGFFKGVSSLGDYDESIAGLRRILDDVGAEQVFTLGNSAGGIGAVSYGLELGARAVLGFSAPVALLDSTDQIDRRTAVFNQRLKTNVPVPLRDFRTRLEEAEGDTEVHLYYGEEMPEDRYHAAFLEGVRNVRLHPLSGLAGHGALFNMAQSGKLRSLFRDTFGETD
ncbi:MAG: hypothetical protein K1X35_03725 [Caulobacteraceae bacterium]|nr:hypothetical protein [Caulobacteraceae bacterium]